MRKPIFRRRSGEGTPMILAIVLVLLMLFCAIAEFSRLWIIAQGVKEAAQQAVISTVNDNYDTHNIRSQDELTVSVKSGFTKLKPSCCPERINKGRNTSRPLT